MTTALYVRTSLQDNDGSAQLSELRAFAGARATVDPTWADPIVYMDRGESGAKASRPEWDRLQGLAKRGKVKRIVVTELSRFGRKLGPLILALDDLTRCGVELVATRQGIDMSTPGGRLIAQVLGAFAEYERESTRERIKAGIKKAQREGSRSGRSIGRPSSGVDVEEINRLRSLGRSWRQIGDALGCSHATARRAVARR